MLKFIYSEADLDLELVNADLEDWLLQRLRFGGSGEDLLVGEERVFFTLPERQCEIVMLDLYLRCDSPEERLRQRIETVTIEPCDADRVEIGLSGYWLSTCGDSSEGIFITELPDRIESYLCQLYAATKDPLVVGQLDLY